MTGARTTADRRAFLALVLGLAAVLSAVIAARGPAVAEAAEYSWPGNLPTPAPAQGWFAPLILARHTADRIAVRAPCGDVPAVAGAGPRVLIFSTVRERRVRHGLEITREPGGRATAVRVGDRRLARIVRPASEKSCTFQVVIDGQTWTVSQSGSPSLRGTLDMAPVVSGFYTELDLRSQPGLRVVIRPHVQDTRPSTTQTALRLLTAALIAAAVLILAPGLARRRRPRIPARPRLSTQDAVVAALIGAWWLLAPLHYDDGWVRARQLNSLASGGFSTYYEYWGTNLPLATWLEWLQHFVLAHSASLFVDRLPTVIVLVVTWLVSRSCLMQLLARGPSRRDTAWWAAALTFGVGAMAFGMTLRPEPAVALLAVGVLACCLRYARAPTFGPLVLGIMLAGLAVTIHPAGSVAVAPLVVCIPQAWRDARNREFPPVGLAALVPAGLAWTLLLAYLDSEIESRSESAALFRGGWSHSQGVLEEPRRYGYLSDFGASPLHREFVVLLLLAVAALLVLRSPRRILAERLPAASISLGLVLLAVTPSKWIWHFGGMLGLAVVAIGFESHRIERGHAARLRPLAIVGLVLCASLWAVVDQNPWGPLDYEHVSWLRMPILYVGATVAAAVVAIAVGRGRQRAHTLVLPAVVATLLALTLVSFTAEAATTRAWTAARQTLASLAGRDACGLASQLMVPTLDSMRPLVRAESSQAAARLASSRLSVPRVLAPTSAAERTFRLRDEPIGIFVKGDHPATDALVVTWGHVGADGFAPLRTGVVPVPPPPSGILTDWIFITEEDFPSRPVSADTVLVAVRGDHGSRATTVTRPVTFRVARLSDLFAEGLGAVVDPFLFEATPCAPLPRLAYGVAEAPDLLVELSWGPDLASRTSPFRGVADAFNTVSVPAYGTGGEDVVVHWAVADPRESVAPPTRHVIEG